MLVKCKSALLLTSVDNFACLYKQLARDISVNLHTESQWSKMYRVNQDVVILSSKYLDKLNEAYYTNAVLMLRSDESPESFIEKGITRFIFDYQDARELRMALYRDTEQVQSYNVTRFVCAGYDFDFEKEEFKYNGKYIYLTKTEKVYLADWLLGGHKDNARRRLLCYIRKRVGSDFLKDIDRFGQIKEEKDE